MIKNVGVKTFFNRDESFIRQTISSDESSVRHCFVQSSIINHNLIFFIKIVNIFIW